MTTTLTTADTRLFHRDFPTLRLANSPRRKDGAAAQTPKHKESPIQSPPSIHILQPSFAQNTAKSSVFSTQTPRAKKIPSSPVTIDRPDVHASPSRRSRPPCACALTDLETESCPRPHTHSPRHQAEAAPLLALAPALSCIAEQHASMYTPPPPPPYTMHPMVRTKARRPRRRTPRPETEDVENRPPTVLAVSAKV